MTIVLVGFVVGVCISYSGVGAGSLTTPLVVLVLGYNVSTAIGSDLLFSLGTKIAALLTHVRARTIDYGALAWLALGGVPGAIAGALVTGWMRTHFALATVEHVLTLVLAAVLLIAAVAVACTRTPRSNGDAPAAALPHAPLALTGLLVGALVSFTSIGSGSLTLPILMLVLSTAQLRRLVGTDVAFAVVLLVPAILGQWRLGTVDVHLAGLLLAGSIPGVIAGAPLASRLPERAFRIGLAVILAAASLRLAF